MYGLLPENHCSMFGLTISTGAGAAVINFLFTVEARITQRAAAAVAPIRVVGAAPTIEARPVSTSHRTQLTVLPIEAWGAGAGVAVLQILGEETRNDQNFV